MSERVETKNAIIEDASFNTELGLSAFVTLNYGGSGQGFGGYLLYAPPDWGRPGEVKPVQPNFAGHFIWRVLQIAGVDDWSKLKGRTVRVRATWNHVEAIGHIVKDDWFDPKAEFERLRSPAGGAK